MAQDTSIREREWLCAKIGYETRILRDEDVLMNFFERVRWYLCEEGLTLSAAPRRTAMISLQVKEILARLHEVLDSRSFVPLPLLLLVEDGQERIRPHIDHYFGRQLCILMFTGTEVSQMISNDSYTQCRQWCMTFATKLLQIEKVSIPVKALEIPIAKESPIMRTREVVHEEEVRPCVDKPHPSAVGIEVIKDVLRGDDLDKLASKIAGPFLLNRMKDPFSDFADNSVLLKLISSAVGARTDDRDINEAIHRLLEYLIESDFLAFIVQQCFRVIDSPYFSNYLESVWIFVKHGVHIFRSAAVILNDNKLQDMAGNWISFSSVFPDIPKQFWDNVDPQEFYNIQKIFHEFNRVFQNTHDVSTPPQSPKKQHAPSPQVIEQPDDEPEDDYLKEHETLWSVCERKPPPENFRTLGIVTSREDIYQPKMPYVRRNIIKGPYLHAEHYLDVLFRLFREDLIAPLRFGIHALNGGQGDDSNQSPSEIILYDVRHIGGIQLKYADAREYRRVVLTSESFSLLFSFPTKALMNGQIVCFSGDGFQNDFHMAIIVERDEDLKKNSFGFHFLTPFRPVEGRKYKIAEAKNYLEAYQFVLKAIQSCNPYHAIPMERYLVYCRTDILKPLYFTSNIARELERDKDIVAYYKQARREGFLQPLPKNLDDGFSRGGQVFPTSRVLYTGVDTMSYHGKKYDLDKLEEEFHPEGLNDSQREAFISAFNQELTLIQGPPGTGKTFVGVEIVRTLLENRNNFLLSSPILVVCYTNAALDQFLEKIITSISSSMQEIDIFGPIACRMGGKAETPFLVNGRYSRNNVVQDYKGDFARKEEAEQNSCFGQRHGAAKNLATLAYGMTASRSDLLSYEAVERVMNNMHKQAFNQMYNQIVRSGNQRLTHDDLLASWLLDRTAGRGDTARNGSNSDFNNRGDVEENFEIEEDNDDGEECVTLAELFQKLNTTVKQEYGEEDIIDPHVNFEMGEQWDITQNVSKCDGDYLLFCSKQNSARTKKMTYDPLLIAEIKNCKQEILEAKPMRKEDADSIVDIFGLTKAVRWSLYAYWRNSMSKLLRGMMDPAINEFKYATLKLQKAQLALDSKVLRNCLVIGATTSGVAKYRELLERIRSQVVVIEEAGEILEAHTFTALLPSLEHLVLIGDHQQLKPNPAVYELGRHYNLNVSLFERLIKNGIPYKSLKLQHRMNTQITRTIVQPFFYEALRDHPCVTEYPDVAGMSTNLFFWSHSQPEARTYSMSYYNTHEVQMVAGLVKYLLYQGHKPSQITVITAYSAQRDRVNDAISNGNFTQKEREDLAVETVDSFQGKENKIVIVSLVRSQGQTIGFLGISNRICVALTRAKHGMYIVGNMQHLRSCSALWEEICDSLVNENLVDYSIPLQCKIHRKETLIDSPKDFERKCRDGGCDEPCSYMLDCGHNCPKGCHPITEHEPMKCYQRCLKKCSNPTYSHPCDRGCGEPCGTCMKLEDVTFPCGHTSVIRCFEYETAYCTKECGKQLTCGHLCKGSCGKCARLGCPTVCTTDVEVPLDCTHFANVPCNRLLEVVPECSAKCSKVLTCGHECANNCGKPCFTICLTPVQRHLECGHVQEIPCSTEPSSFSCLEPIKVTFPDCFHTGQVPCGVGADPIKCANICGRQLPCGHKCMETCGLCSARKEHRCVEMCCKELPCGHNCMASCGVKCECRAQCLTHCAHQQCGDLPGLKSHSNSYGRKCVQQCAVCPKSCDNICAHRSCDKKCFEICNVNHCEEPCTRALPCGHSCLGMCGEVCPNVCGMCCIKEYESVISILGKTTTTKIHRLIVLPSCRHTFPVQTVDLEVRNCMMARTWPRCPDKRCRRPIVGVQRYAKFLKELMFNKFEVTVNSLPQMVPISTVSILFKRIVINLVDRTPGAKKDVQRHIDIVRFYNSHNWKSIRMVSKHLYDCTLAFNKIYDNFLELAPKIPNKNLKQPILEKIFSRVFLGSSLKQMTSDSIDELFEWISTNKENSIAGSFVPKACFLMFRCFYLVTLLKLVTVLTKTNNDVGKVENEVSSLLAMFKNTTPSSDYFENHEKLINFIKNKIDINKTDFLNWSDGFKLCLPEF